MRARLIVTLALGAGLVGCSADPGPIAEPEGEEQEASLPPSPFEVARLDVEGGQVAFLALGDGIAVAETWRGISYSRLMDEQERTPLELFVALSREEPPAQLVDAHQRTAARLPVAVDLAEVDALRVARAADVEARLFSCRNVDTHATARARFDGTPCYTGTDGGVDSGYQNDARREIHTYANDGYTLSSDEWLYMACSENSKMYNDIWVYDSYVGQWQLPYENILIDTDQAFEFHYRGFARRLLFYSVTTPNAVGVFDLASLQSCR
jgi:hypothetical protein